MLLEFVNTNELGKRPDKDDIFEMEFPKYTQTCNLDTYVSKKDVIDGIDSTELPFHMYLLAMKNYKPDTVSKEEQARVLLTQLPYFCMEFSYKHRSDEINKFRSVKSTKNILRKYKSFINMVNSNRLRCFLYIDEGDIIVNAWLYNTKKPEEIYPLQVFKIPLQTMIDFVASFDPSFTVGSTFKSTVPLFTREFKIKDFSFSAFNRDMLNDIIAVTRIDRTINSRSTNTLPGGEYGRIYETAYRQQLTMMREYCDFMAMLYNYRYERRHRISSTIGQIDNVEILLEEKMTQDQKDHIIYLGRDEYIYSSANNSNIRKMIRIGRKRSKQKYEQDVSGYTRTVRGKVQFVDTYVRGKGLPKRPGKTTYIDDRPNDNTNK